MNVYDFDQTIFKKDSSVLLICYILRHNPKTWKHLGIMGYYGLLYALKKVDKKTMKEHIFQIFQYVNMQDTLALFVERYQSLFQSWYLKQQRSDDVIISASPQFLVKAFCQKKNITNVYGSPVDQNTGQYFGENCHGQQKVVVFKQVYGDTIIDGFYSDSLSDSPLAQLATKAYLVKGEHFQPWPKEK